MSPRTARVSRADHLQELFELSEERDRLHAELREETRERREELKRLDLRIHRVRDIVAGRDHVQEEIPGTETVTTKPATAKKNRRRCKHGTEIGSGVECESCRADIEWEKEQARLDIERAKKAAKTSKSFPEDDAPARTFPVEDQVEGKTYTVPSLSWTKAADGHWIGVAVNGLVWSVDRGARGWRWSQGKLASGNFDDVIAAKADAEADARARVDGGK